MSAKAKLLLLIGLMSTCVIITVSSLGFLKFKSSSIDASRQTLEVQSLLISKALDEKMNRMFDTLNVVSQHINFTETGELADIHKSDPSVEFSNLLSLLDTLKQHFQVSNAYIGLADGLTYSIKTKGIIPNFNAKEKKREWFTRVFNGEKKIVTRPYLSATKTLVMAVAVPVVRNGKIVGALSISLTLDRITKFIESLDEKNQVYVSRSDGFVLAADNQEFIGTSLFDQIPQLETMNGRSDSNHTYTYQDKEYFVFTAELSDLGWTVWAFEPWENILAGSNSNLFSSILIAIVFISISLVLVYIFVQRLMYIPIGGEPKVIEELVKKVANGDLTSKQELTGKETGIYASVITMVQNLRTIMLDINRTASVLDQSSTDILNSANEVNDRSQSQMEKLEHAVVSMNEMAMTVQDIAQNALVAESSADSAYQSVVGGKSTVTEMNTSINSLVSGIEEVQQVIIELDKETTSVGSILDVISGISEQTNLLALNAAIEAARAGDSGRGFAVVADEVRGLATKTKDSTNEIQSMISTLQSAAKTSVELMQKNAVSATETGDKSGIANQSLSNINDSTVKIKDMNSLIATSAEEQATVAQIINSSIDEINKLAKLTNDDSEQNKVLAKGIAEVAQSLKKSVDSFKV